MKHQALRNLLTTPLIYSLGLPLLILDIWISVYQWVCFPVYGNARVRRDRYSALDRHRLADLTTIEKANCLYCSYATGMLAFVREVAARTEQYCCPIKHGRRVTAPHRRYAGFFAYGDAHGLWPGLVANATLAAGETQRISSANSNAPVVE